MIWLPGADAVPHGFLDLIPDRTVPSLSIGGTILNVNGFPVRLPSSGAVRVVVPVGWVQVGVRMLLPVRGAQLRLSLSPGQVIPVFHRHSWIRNHPGFLTTQPIVGAITPRERHTFKAVGIALAAFFGSIVVSLGAILLVIAWSGGM